MEAKEKSTFCKEVTVIAERLADLVNTMSKDGTKRAVILLASEARSENGSSNIIAINGDGKQAFEVLADFATQNETKDLFKAANVFATIKEHI